MNVYGIDLLLRHLKGEIFQIKAVFSERGCVFGPVERQHVELVGEGIQYRTDGKGNALAAMLYSGKFEVRRDGHFSEARVESVFRKLVQCARQDPLLSADAPCLEVLSRLQLVYGGKALQV